MTGEERGCAAGAPDFGYYRRESAAELMARLSTGETLLAQGAMGTALLVQGADIPPAYWNIAEPQAVEYLHRMYVVAGADVAVTNTFQASGPCLRRDRVFASVREANDAAVRAARAAQPAYVLGSVGPCGIDYLKEDDPAFREARAAYREQCHALLASGVDGVLLETFPSIRELVPALRGALDVSDGMPVLVSFAVDGKGDLVGDGLNVEAAIVYAEKHGADAVGANCCALDEAQGLAERMLAVARTPVMLRPSAGLPEHGEDGAPAWPDLSERFAAAASSWREAGVALVGSCCGTDARTTCAMRAALDE